MPSPAVLRASDVPSLLRALMDDDPGRPRLTWYGPSGERVELSAKVTDNWVAKTAGLLVEDLDAGPGTTVLLDLPAHWRGVVWALAAWSCGAHVRVAGGRGPRVAIGLDPGDVVVSADPAALPGTPAHVVAQALPALAVSFAGPLPPGALDAAVEVRSHADVFVPPVRPAPGDSALTGEGEPLTHADLLPAARDAAAGWPDGPRLLTWSGDPVGGWLAPLAVGGSLVLVHDPALADDRLAAQEGVTVRA